MPELKRTSPKYDTQRSRMGTGIYVGRVINNLDPTFMGSLEVSIFRDSGNKTNSPNQHFIVRYASPFFGHTPYEYTGLNKGDNNTSEGFNDTQKSYGMWMVPPDIGVTVLCAFVDGDPSQGYWFACIPAKFANHMVPAIGSSREYYIDANDKKRYGPLKDGSGNPQPLPVAEFNKRINAQTPIADPKKIKKPVHPIAEQFLKQGLLEDDVRGPATSSSRREAPSSVLGISSPGPLDRRNNSKRVSIGDADETTPAVIPAGRLGGTQLVMDDGDDRYIRKKPAGELGVGSAYADVLNKESGDPTIPADEYFRVRTRTGHQLLLHNSEDLIYIGNARGTTWIELTSNGKIDIFAEDSVSIHTKNDFNFYADRDFNLECGRNVNIKAKGRLNGDFNQNVHLRSGLDMKVFVSETFDLKIGTAAKITTGNSLDLAVGTNLKMTAFGTTDIYSSSALKVTSGATIDIGAGGNIVVSGARIDLNGPKAATAATAASAATAPPLSTHEVSATAVGNWAEKKYQAGTLSTIMKRVPMHEPWLFHENVAPDITGPASTDREVGGDLASEHQSTTEASQVSASAAHVAEINDYDAKVPDAATGKPVIPESIEIPKGGVQLTADFFAPSKYGKRTADNLNTLDPTVRSVFAKAIKAFILEYNKDGWDMSVSECLRPLSRSKELYEAFIAGRGPQAASPGNSWHNYGAAADILIYKNGVWDSLNKTGAYTGFAQQFLRTQGIHNNAGANDSGHFVPLQMPVGVPKVVKTGAVSIAQIMSGEKKV